MTRESLLVAKKHLLKDYLKQTQQNLKKILKRYFICTTYRVIYFTKLDCHMS